MIFGDFQGQKIPSKPDLLVNVLTKVYSSFIALQLYISFHLQFMLSQFIFSTKMARL